MRTSVRARVLFFGSAGSTGFGAQVQSGQGLGVHTNRCINYPHGATFTLIAWYPVDAKALEGHCVAIVDTLTSINVPDFGSITQKSDNFLAWRSRAILTSWIIFAVHERALAVPAVSLRFVLAAQSISRHFAFELTLTWGQNLRCTRRYFSLYNIMKA